MKSVDSIAAEIVTREGGFVNDPDDPGGATKFGVTIGTMRSLGVDLDGDSDVDIADVRLLSRSKAQQIFVKNYFEKPGIGRLPKVVQASVFDMYVNSGSNAVKILQRVINAFGVECAVDGVIGRNTVKAAQQVALIAPNHFADAYAIARRNYYYALADSRAASRKYARRKDGGKGGWILRAEEFMGAKYHLSLAHHSERVAQWV